MPSNVLHNAQGTGATECYALFVDQAAIAGLPTSCCTLAVSPLLRELLLQASGFDPLYDEQGAEGRLIGVLLDQLAAAPIENLHLPVSNDARIRQLTERLLADPADKATLSQWAQRIGMSERTLNRTLQQQMGMSFGHWRRQLHVMLALQRLTKGRPYSGWRWIWAMRAPVASSPCFAKPSANRRHAIWRRKPRRIGRRVVGSPCEITRQKGRQRGRPGKFVRGDQKS